MRQEIRITGFGGQGVILCGYIIGKAASIYSNYHATMTQSFGPEARGSACSSCVVISDTQVLYPYLTTPDILIALSQDGYTKYQGEIKKDGIIIIEEDLVKNIIPRDDIKFYKCPATKLAEELGRRIVVNIVMLGYFSAVCKLIPADAMREAVKTSVPKGTEALNLAAFDKGYNYFTNQK
jgi:2-oxoglutarate ferredoxin oxidoreductase subunit gamma